MRRVALAAVAVVLLTGCASAQRQAVVSYIDDDGGRLSARVGSTRTETGSYWFEFGRTPELGRQTAPMPVDFVAGESQTVLHNLDHLDPDTTYYWRACADDQDPQQPAPGCSDVGSFKTLPTPPGKPLEVGSGWNFVRNERDRSFNREGPFTFEGPAVVTVLDSYCASDRLRLFDNGVAIGATSRVAERPGCAPYVLTLEESLADPEHYSRGSFPLGPGTHSIRLRLLAGEGNHHGNSGYIRADSLEP